MHRTKTIRMLFGLLPMCLHGMDFLIAPLPHDVVINVIKQLSISSTGYTRSEEIPAALCMKQRLQMMSSLRILNTKWAAFLTVPTMCAIGDIKSQELALFECQRAGNINLTHEQLRKKRKNKDESLSKEVDILIGELGDQFKGMAFFLDKNIIHANLPLLIDKSSYHKATQEEICQTKKTVTPHIESDDTQTIWLSLLHYALRCGAQSKFIELLTNNGADVHHDIYDHTIRTPLYVCAIYDSPSENFLILKTKDADPNASDPDGNTLLHSLVFNEKCGDGLRISAMGTLQFIGADNTIPNKDGHALSDYNINVITQRNLGIGRKILIKCLQLGFKVAIFYMKKHT